MKASLFVKRYSALSYMAKLCKVFSQLTRCCGPRDFSDESNWPTNTRPQSHGTPHCRDGGALGCRRLARRRGRCGRCSAGSGARPVPGGGREADAARPRRRPPRRRRWEVPYKAASRPGRRTRLRAPPALRAGRDGPQRDPGPARTAARAGVGGHARPAAWPRRCLRARLS